MNNEKTSAITVPSNTLMRSSCRNSDVGWPTGCQAIDVEKVRSYKKKKRTRSEWVDTGMLLYARLLENVRSKAIALKGQRRAREKSASEKASRPRRTRSDKLFAGERVNLVIGVHL